MMGVMERELKARRRERVTKQDVRVVASDGERHKWPDAEDKQHQVRHDE